jgi:predicted kinase
VAEPLQHPGLVLEQPAILVITGLMAAGKSTVAQSLAQRLPSAAHVRGDAFRRMIVSRRAELTPPLSAAGRTQLNLRHRLAALVADEYATAGITAVVQDVYLGDDLSHFLSLLRHRPIYLAVLAPRPNVIARRERARGKTGYGQWSIAAFDTLLREQTPQLGLWVDNSDLSVEETVDAILSNLSGSARHANVGREVDTHGASRTQPGPVRRPRAAGARIPGC